MMCKHTSLELPSSLIIINGTLPGIISHGEAARLHDSILGHPLQRRGEEGRGPGAGGGDVLGPDELRGGAAVDGGREDE
jgi:hypothetical protein